MRKLGLTQISLWVAVLIIAAVGIAAFVIIGNFSDSYACSRADEMRSTVVSYVAQCYALEGEYPPDLEYLEANYGLQLDKGKYIYHYELFAGNIFPDVQVFTIRRDGD